jgi:hypothetical protein
MFSGGNVKALASPQRSQIIMDFAPSNSLSLFLIIRIAYTENGNAVHKRRSRRSPLGNVQKGLTSPNGTHGSIRRTGVLMPRERPFGRKTSEWPVLGNSLTARWRRQTRSSRLQS